ncbi:MAG: pantoate--beta-alanine ligase [bacterium]
MRVLKNVNEMRAEAARLRNAGKTIGLVPTMGYFHEGHLSLMRAARAANDAVVTTLFVNPAQFAPAEDFDRYPRDFDRDQKLAEQAGVDILFRPDRGAMYPTAYRTYVQVEELGAKLCGASRPGFFRGVTTVCCKLFNICRPHRAYFGLKDAQQAFIIAKMVKDLDMDVEIVKLPTVREQDGLAMSSRNAYLGAADRKSAAALFEALSAARTLIASGTKDPAQIKAKLRSVLDSEPRVEIDYVSVADTESFEEVAEIAEGNLVAVAVNLGGARLIDNIIVETDRSGTRAARDERT